MAAPAHDSGIPLKRHRRRASMSVVIVILALSATAMITATLSMTTGATSVQRSALMREQAVFLADAALEHALIRLKNDRDWRDGFADVPLGAGTYSAVLVDDDGDAADDDEDGSVDEDPADGTDNDADGMIDEDFAADIGGTGGDDDDNDGSADEDSTPAIVYYLDGADLMEWHPDLGTNVVAKHVSEFDVTFEPSAHPLGWSAVTVEIEMLAADGQKRSFRTRAVPRNDRLFGP